MHTPQLNRIEPYSRLSGASRADESRNAAAGDGFAAQLRIGEEARGRWARRRPPDDEPSEGELWLDLSGDAETDAGYGDPPEAEDILPQENFPEDAQDPQELRALLTLAIA